jgi:hypothetical protein
MEQLKKTSLLITGFMAGIAFIVGCDDNKVNQAQARLSTEQMICQLGFNSTSDSRPGFHRATSNSTVGDVLDEAVVGSNDTSGTYSHILECRLLSDTQDINLKTFQELNSEGWSLVSIVEGVALFNK